MNCEQGVANGTQGVTNGTQGVTHCEPPTVNWKCIYFTLFLSAVSATA